MMPGEGGGGEAVPACNRLKIWVSSVTLKSCCQRVVFALEQCSPSCDSFSFNLQKRRQNLSVQMVPREAKSGKEEEKKRKLRLLSLFRPPAVLSPCAVIQLSTCQAWMHFVFQPQNALKPNNAPFQSNTPCFIYHSHAILLHLCHLFSVVSD